jgi:hypothetical protein
MALRSTYSTGVFNSGLYGEPETTQGAVSASVGLSVVVSAVTVVFANAPASVDFVSSSPTGVRVADASASASLAGIATASAVKYQVVPGFRSGYGRNTFGSYVYGENYSIEDASVSTPIGVSAVASAQVTRNVSAAVQIVFAPVSSAVIDTVGAASTTVSILPQIVYNRVRLMAATDSIGFTASVSARYKWLESPNPTTSWNNADYLERAA